VLKEKLDKIKSFLYKLQHHVVEPQGSNPCPYCGHELDYHDSFGRFLGHQDGKRVGNIYKCPNEHCESEVFNYYFYDYVTGDLDLYEGYPC
jgi:hypothetical protein